RFTRSIKSYCRIIGGGDDFFCFTAFSMTWGTILRLRSSGARARGWFFMRGRLGEEGAMLILGYLRGLRWDYTSRISSRLLTATRQTGEPPPDSGARERERRGGRDHTPQGFTLLPLAVPRAE